MIKVKVKTPNNINLSIPVPYVFLNAASSILTSEMLLKRFTKLANKHAEHQAISFIAFNHKLPKQLLKQILRELRQHKGLVLVDAKLKDGTEVLVRL